MRYFIYISYLGKSYSGWQIQKNAVSVQQVVEAALSKLLCTRVAISGSSRTDKGVHALQQVAHFDLNSFIDIANLIYRLNRILPPDVSITTIRPVIDGAHARFDACYRRYAYTITTQKDPFYRGQAFWLHQMPPLALLNQIAAVFCREADFEFFSKKSDGAKHFICKIEEAFWMQIDQKRVFYIKANRFLRGMVRIIVDNMLKVANGKMDLARLEQLIREKPMVRPMVTLMPPDGLTLMEVGYPGTVFIQENAL